MINKQIQQQLDYLKYLVDMEVNEKKNSDKWNLPYTPSRRKWLDIENYNEYLKEIEKNGEKNLLVMVKLNMDGCKLNGEILPFARREAHMSYGTYFLIHRTKNGADILVMENEAEIIK